MFYMLFHFFVSSALICILFFSLFRPVADTPAECFRIKSRWWDDRDGDVLLNSFPFHVVFYILWSCFVQWSTMPFWKLFRNELSFSWNGPSFWVLNWFSLCLDTFHVFFYLLICENVRYPNHQVRHFLSRHAGELWLSCQSTWMVMLLLLLLFFLIIL